MDTRLSLSASALKPDPVTGLWVIREAFGLDHERQILTVECPAALPASCPLFQLRDKTTGAIFPAQRSQQNPAEAFVLLVLSAGKELQLAPQAEAPDHPVHAVQFSTHDIGSAVISNGKWAVEIFLGEWKLAGNSTSLFQAPGPIRRLRIGEGPWRGKTFFDTHQPVQQVSSTVLESGPLRVVTQFEARFGTDYLYTARFTFDAESDHVVVDEHFTGDAGDQIVWDFSGNDLPQEIHLLDPSAGFTTQSLHYFYDGRLARLACWNQYSQLHDYSDGYALGFSHSRDVIGYVALKGGDWRGNAHNFLEAWTRRWFPGDPLSRRLVPPETKADASPSPEKIAARPVNWCESHFSIEGWLHRGRRQFALVLTTRDDLRSAQWNDSPPLGHFETQPNRTRYRQQQSLLRRIHTRHGLFPLDEQLALASSWPGNEAPAHSSEIPPWENPGNHYTTSDQKRPESIPERIEQMLQFLTARVYGFWEGSGSAYTNAVVSRRLVHDLLDWEWLAANGYLSPEQFRQSRAWFLFLSGLFSTEHYYPGAAAMNMGEPGLRLEPTIAGMANQNFFTDVFTMPGVTAQIFPTHPHAAAWRERFTRMWRRQLEYHVYPESGVWEESHTYFHHVLATVLPALERRLEDGVDDGFADPLFQRAVGFLLKTLTPRDAFFKHQRHVVALGDHGVDLKDLYRPFYRRLAHRLAKTNPELAAQMDWAYRELGGTEALAVEPKPFPWKPEYVQGLGYFFRAQDSRAESLLVLRCGTSWGHHHNDEGSLQYFYAGRSWVVDSAFSYPQREGIRKFRADGHSRWAPRDLAPLNHFWQFNRGWINHQSDTLFPCAVAFTPVYMVESPAQLFVPLRRAILHWRAVVQLAPSTFLVLDRSDIELPQVARMHVPAQTPLALENNPALAATDGLHLRLRSLWGWHPPQIITTDHPTQAPDDFITREIRFDSNGSPVAAFLFAVESQEARVATMIRTEEKKITLQHPEFAVELDLSRPDALRLIDTQTGREQIVPLLSQEGQPPV